MQKKKTKPKKSKARTTKATKIHRWSYAAPKDGEAFPSHLVEAVWSFLQWSVFLEQDLRKPRSQKQLSILVYEAFQASLATEEGRQVTFHGVFDPAVSDLTIRFKDPRPYNANELIRLAPTIGLNSRLLVASPKAGQ